MIAHCAEWEAEPEGTIAKRFSLPFDIDGLVIKLDDLAQRKKLGSTAKHVRWATAFKFEAKYNLTC